MAERRELARPIMRRGAGLDPNDAGRQLLKERQNMPALQPTADDHRSRRVDAMDLKDRLRDIKTVCMSGSPNRGRPSGDLFNGTYVPEEEPSTASIADLMAAPGLCGSYSGVSNFELRV
jgi:hypothetical protein